MARYDIVQGDLTPAVSIQLDGLTTSIEGLPVTFTMTQVGGTVTATGAAAIDTPGPPTALVHYQWNAGDTDVPGVYRAQATVTWPGGLPETWPSNDVLYIVIHPSVTIGATPYF